MDSRSSSRAHAATPSPVDEAVPWSSHMTHDQQLPIRPMQDGDRAAVRAVAHRSFPLLQRPFFSFGTHNLIAESDGAILGGIASGGITFGSGYREAQALLSDQDVSILYAPLKAAALLVSYLVGMPGGIFAPTLSIGAGVGQLVSLAFPDVALSALIALAMVGYLAAVTQAPITSFVIMMEMTDGHAMVIALMATAVIASSVSKAR